MLVTQAEACNQSAIAVRAFLAQIGKQAPTMPNHEYQTMARMQVVLMHFHMLGHLINASCQDGYLDFRRTGICFMNAGIGNDFRLFVNG